jgi:DNA adenine methylase
MYYYSPKLDKYNYLVEPFFGGGSYSLNHPYATKYRKVFINDKDRQIFDLCISIRNEPEKLLDAIEKVPNSEGYFYYLRDEFTPQTQLENALKRLYLQYFSFGGKVEHWCPTINAKQRKRINLDENKMKFLKSRLDKFVIFNTDYSIFLSYFIWRKEMKNVFFYLDPPYLAAKKSKHYLNVFDDWEEHVKLKNLLDKVHESGHLFELSYDFDERISKLYEDYNINEVSLNYSISKQRDARKELIITNYDEFAKKEYVQTENIKKQRSIF